MCLEASKDGVRIHLYVQPNGKKSEILGQHDGRLKIRIQAPPVEGRANEAVEEFVAALMGVGRRHVAFVRGVQSRQKVVEVTGLNLAQAQARLAPYL